jgi:hypothetical protein
MIVFAARLVMSQSTHTLYLKLEKSILNKLINLCQRYRISSQIYHRIKPPRC